MLPIESLLCPCCTPALLHTLAQTNFTRIPQQILWLGTGALAATVQQQKSRSQQAGIKNIVRKREAPCPSRNSG
ncbi:hypothetical protein [Leptodesmis sp.]|uniref:hypothetical protein n=1 Tax=Leptodesmis sp. TaxID=3100501 RepID=UPI004053575E